MRSRLGLNLPKNALPTNLFIFIAETAKTLHHVFPTKECAMKILAIDTSCDESCAAIIDTDSWKLIGEVVHTHIDLMQRFGGIVPEIASREHLKGLPLAVHEVLQQAQLTPSQIDWVAVTNRPGLIGALLVGVSFGKAFAFALGKHFSPIHHLEGHLFSPLLASLEDQPTPAFPWIALVVSGGHTELFHVQGPLQYQWLGGTLDDAAGEAFDKIGKLLGLPYPAGPKIDAWVREKASAQDRKAFAFPRARTEEFSFSFSGLKTAVALEIKAQNPLGESQKLSIAASAQEAILDALADKVVRASQSLGVSQIVVTGGVACNSRLREKLPQAYFPRPKHCSDNAAMIALVAGLKARQGLLSPAPWSTTASASADIF